MNIPCEVIKDLLPLYMEDMASGESAKLVEAHLSSCDECKQELEDMKAVRVIPVQTDPETLRRLKTAIVKRRLFTAFTAVMVVFSLFFGFYKFLYADVWIPGEAAIQRVEQDPDGKLTIYTNNAVHGSGFTWDYNADHVAFIASMRMKNYLFLKDAAQTEEVAIPQEIPLRGMDGLDLSDRHFWYVNIWDGTAGMPLWGTEGAEVPVGPIVAASYLLYYYCGILLVMGMVFAMVSRRRSGKAGRAFQVLSILCFCLLIGILLTCGGQLVTYYDGAPWKIRDSLSVTLSLFVTVLSILKLYRWKKQDEIL